MRTGKKISLALASTALSSLVLTGSVVAAETAGFSLEEITVTAQKVEQNLQSTPVSVTAMTAQMMSDMGVNNIREVERFTPNLLASPGFSGGDSDANFFIRGIGQIDFVVTSDPGVGLYIDGVFIGRTVGGALDTADVERVEVLRGPQGTLFGKNTIGGAVNVITKMPSDEPGGYVEATVGNFGRTDGQFSANMPITDTFFARVSGSMRHNDGFAKRVIDGEDVGNSNDVSGRLALRWLASETVDVLLSADVTKRRANIAAHSNIITRASGAGNTFLADTGLNVLDFGPSADPRKINTTSVRPNDDLNVFGTSGTIKWDLGDAELKSITAYRKMDQVSAADFDGTVLVFNDQEIYIDQKQFSQEIQINGVSFDDQLQWIAGVYYMNEKSYQQTINYGQSGIAAGFLPDGRRETSINLTTNNFAAYGQATFHVTDQLGLTGGIRWTHEKKKASVFNERSFIGGVQQPATFVGEETWNNLSPRLAVEYQATDDLLAYASVTRGFKSGSFNGRPDRAAGFIPYDPEKVTAFEAGFKSEMLDRRVRLNASAFLTKYKAIQLLTGTIDDIGTLFFPVANAGDLEIRGFEAELQARPVEDLSIFASIGYADEKWTDIYDGPFPVVTEDTRLPSMSHWNLVVGGQYNVMLGDFGSLLLGGDWSYRSSYYHTTTNSDNIKEDGYGLLGAHAVIEPANANWSLTFWGKNLTDAEYYGWGQDLIPIGNSHGTVWFGRPREYGATFRINL